MNTEKTPIGAENNENETKIDSFITAVRVIHQFLCTALMIKTKESSSIFSMMHVCKERLISFESNKLAKEFNSLKNKQ